jgi:hypothetical protein
VSALLRRRRIAGSVDGPGQLGNSMFCSELERFVFLDGWVWGLL